MRSHLKLMHHIEVDTAKQVAAKDEQKVLMNQLFLAHGIQLAICDVLYKTTPVQEVIPDLNKEDSVIDDITISDGSDHEDEEVVGYKY